MARRPLVLALASATLVLGATWLWAAHQDGVREAHLAEARALWGADFASAPELHDLDAGGALAGFEAAEALGAEVTAEREAAEALAFLQGGDLTSAAGSLREAKRGGWTARLRLIAAAIAMGRGHVEEAEEGVREALIAEPPTSADHRRALLALGDLALDRGEPRAAADAFEGLARLEPTVAPLHNRLGLAREGLGRLDEARAAVARAVALDPSLADAWVNQGRQARSAGDLDAAARSFRRATELAPGRADAWLGQGLAALDDGDLDAARVSLERARELDETAVDVSLAMADLLVAEGRREEAADAYRAALRDNLHHAAGWVKLGNVLFALGNKREAAFAHRQALERDPTLAAAHNGLGAALMGVDDDAAREALRRAAELDRSDPNPLMNLALLAERAGATEEARDAWRGALERAPGTPIAAARLAALR